MHKPVFLAGWLRKSLLLTADEFERLKTGAEVLKRDAHGIKVLRLPNGDILKRFRVKRLVSSARLYSYARSFCRNAERLHALGIPTVAILQLFQFPDRVHSAVLYQQLPGKTYFRHLCRLASDRLVFGMQGWELFLQTYREASRLRLCSEKSFFSKAARLFDVWSLQEERL